MREKDTARHELIVIELRDKKIRAPPQRDPAVRTRKIRAIAPVLAVAEEEDLNAGLAAFLSDGENIAP